MPLCKKGNCKKSFPNIYTSPNGKKHNLQTRKFCLDCSPFGSHNTKDLNKQVTRICQSCSRASKSKRSLCFSCSYKKRRTEKREKIYKIVGTSCWYCNYDRGFKAIPVLEFHHLNEEEKLFDLSARAIVGFSWNRVKKELKKCVLLCCRCHREYHYGFIDKELLIKLHETRWKKCVDR